MRPRAWRRWCGIMPISVGDDNGDGGQGSGACGMRCDVGCQERGAQWRWTHCFGRTRRGSSCRCCSPAYRCATERGLNAWIRKLAAGVTAGLGNPAERLFAAFDGVTLPRRTIEDLVKRLFETKSEL